LDRLLRDDLKLSKKTQKSFIERLAHIEYIVDQYYQEVVKFYIIKGLKANPDNFSVNYEDISKSGDKRGLSYENLKMLARRETEKSIIREKSLNPEKKEREQTTGELLELVKAKFDRFNSNNEFMDNTIYYFKTRRDYPIHSVLFELNKRHLTLFSIYQNGVIEGYKEKSQTLGKLSSSLKLPLVESRRQLIKIMANHSREFEDYNNFYGVSINRLTFEFFELRSTKSIYFGISERDGTSQELLDENTDCEVYSIIDIKNNSLQLPVVFNGNESYKLTIPKYDYNLLDNTDEHTIRRFMDFIYHENSDGYLTYDSNEVNNIATGKWDSSEVNSIARGKKDSSEVNNAAKGKRVHFTKEDIDHKKGKIPGKYYRKVRFTQDIDFKKGKKPGKYNDEMYLAIEERVGKAKEIREGEKNIPKSLKKSADHYPKRKPRMMLPTEKPIPPLPKKRKAIALLPPEEPINTPNPPKRRRIIALLPPEEPNNTSSHPKG
jgi:hypothetical protein